MKNLSIVVYTTENYLTFLKPLKEAFLFNNLMYSSRDLQTIQPMSANEIDHAIHIAIAICQTIGVDSNSHFKKIFVFDLPDKTIKSEWRLSKNGFNLAVMQFQQVSHKNAIWFWQLANV